MKKLAFITLFVGLLLTACSDKAVEVVVKENGFTEQTVEFGKTFILEDEDDGQKVKAEVLLTNFQIEQNLSVNAEHNEKYDYYTFDAKITNVGDGEVSDVMLDHLSFDFYENGKEIELPLILIPEYTEEVFEPANLRSGGVNEGKIIITAPKGTAPTEMIYEENFLSIFGTDSYRLVIE